MLSFTELEGESDQFMLKIVYLSLAVINLYRCINLVSQLNWIMTLKKCKCTSINLTKYN